MFKGISLSQAGNSGIWEKLLDLGVYLEGGANWIC